MYVFLDPPTPPLQFTSVELYQAYADYEDMMTLCEALIRDCATQACGTLQVGGEDEGAYFGKSCNSLRRILILKAQPRSRGRGRR